MKFEVFLSPKDAPATQLTELERTRLFITASKLFARFDAAGLGHYITFVRI